jgi:hypothetical protein
MHRNTRSIYGEASPHCPWQCFNLLLKTFANHPKHVLSQKAEWFLYMNANRSDWKPNSESLELVIEAVAKSRQHDAAKQAFFLLQRFQSQITNPACLSYVLLACARASFSTLADTLQFQFSLPSSCQLERTPRSHPFRSLQSPFDMCCSICTDE